MATSAEEAVAFTWERLATPTRVMPFFELYLPYYDPIRDAPVYVEPVQGLEAG